jgi:molecular chaperone DnaK
MRKGAPAIGIDLGTTYSCMAYVDESNRPVVIRNFEGENTTPSVVSFAQDNPIIGRTAKQSASANPGYVVQFAKRYMGTDHRFFIESGVNCSPEEISSYILRKLKNDASQALGMEITDAVITVPAYFGVDERQATKKAGELADLNVLGIIPEPIAAAFAYGNTEQERNVLVYDLGGGTFDVTVIQFTPETYKTIVVDGNKELGGKDWDDRIIRHLVTQFAEKTGTDEAELYDDPETMADLQDIAERVIKRSLTVADTAKANVSHGGLREPVTVTRKEFDEMTADLLERTISLTKAALGEAEKKGVANIDEILLVGGSTRMRQIIESMRREFGKEPQIYDPDEAVAKGAAIAARNEAILRLIQERFGEVPLDTKNLSEEDRSNLEELAAEAGTDLPGLLGSVSKTYETVCSKSFGVVSFEMPGRIEKVFNLIIRNTPLPTTCERPFYTIDEAQNSVTIRIMENVVNEEKAEVQESKELGQGNLEFGKPMPKRTPIEVKFTMKSDGTLDIEARERSTGRMLEVSIETPNVIHGEELKQAMQRSSALTF